MTKSMIPLATGMLLPLSTFLNVQALSIPGWTASLSSLNHCLRHSPIDDKLPLPDPVVFYPNEIIAILLSLSFSSGILANLALFNRLLFERKIKTMQRVVFYGSISQGLFCLVANLLFIEEWLQMPRERTVTGGPMYSFATALVSFLVAVLLLIQQRRNLAQEHYDYTLLDLSNAQRQSVLLTMLTISYTLGMALVFSYIEGWEYDDALYWSVTTLTTIGFGDIAPKSISGRVCLPPMAFVGIGVVGANIWSVRQMILELLTHRLASEYSKSLGITRDDASLPDRHDWTKRFSLDSAAFPSQVGHCDTAPTVMDRPRSHHSLDDSVLPDHIVDFAEHSLSLPKTLKRQSSSSQRSLSRSRSFASVMPDEPAPRKALVISRGKHLPRLTIVGGSDLKRRQIADTTMQTFRAEIWTSVLLEVANVCIFGSVFAYLENWALMDGIYFATTALLTIGYGDLILCRTMSRSIFIWYAFLGIAVTTYLGSIVGEYAVDQWTVTVSKIEKRVDRYEKKAELKRWFQGSKKLKLNGKGSHDSLSSNVDSQTLLQIRNDSQEASSSTDTPKVPPAIIVPSAHLKHTRSSSVVVSETGPFLDSEAPEELLHAHSVPSGHQNALHHFVRLDQPDTMATDRLARRLFSSFKTRHGGATESESTDLMATSSEEGESRNEQQDPSRGRLKVLRKRTARRLLSGFKTSPRPPLPPNRRHEGSDDPSNDPSAPLLGP